MFTLFEDSKEVASYIADYVAKKKKINNNNNNNNNNKNNNN